MARLRRLVIGGSLITLCGLSQAKLVTFDDTSYGPLGVYAGLDWLSGYDTPGVNSFSFGALGNALVSAPAIAYWTGFNSNDPLIISTIAPGQSFAFNSGYFTAAANDDLTITVVGGTGSNTVTHTATFLVNTRAPTFKSFDWSGLNFVYMYGSGGVRNPAYSGGSAFVIDNVTLDAPIMAAVPESATWKMGLVGGLAMLVFSRLRKAMDPIGLRAPA